MLPWWWYWHHMTICGGNYSQMFDSSNAGKSLLAIGRLIARPTMECWCGAWTDFANLRNQFLYAFRNHENIGGGLVSWSWGKRFPLTHLQGLTDGVCFCALRGYYSPWLWDRKLSNPIKLHGLLRWNEEWKTLTVTKSSYMALNSFLIFEPHTPDHAMVVLYLCALTLISRTCFDFSHLWLRFPSNGGL